MSSNQKKEGHSGLQTFTWPRRGSWVFVPLVHAGLLVRLHQRLRRTTESALLGSLQPAPSALSMTSAPKSIVKFGPIPEPETEDIREKTRQLVEQRLSLKIADPQALPDPKVLVEKVRKDLKKHHTDTHSTRALKEF